MASWAAEVDLNVSHRMCEGCGRRVGYLALEDFCGEGAAGCGDVGAVTVTTII